MMDKLDKHPSWFKLKVERRELVKQLAPETAVNVLLACWDYLETGERPTGLSPIEDVALSVSESASPRSTHLSRNSAQQISRFKVRSAGSKT